MSTDLGKGKLYTISRERMAKSVQKGLNERSDGVSHIFKGVYQEKHPWRLRPDDPTKQIHQDRIKIKGAFRTENERIREEISKLHPIMREGFDIEGYHNY